MRTAQRVLCALGIAVLVLLATTTGASAHSELLAGAPGVGSTAQRAVTSIALTFGSPLAPELADVVVLDGAGADRVDGDPAVRGSVVTVPVRPLDVAGRYAVSYRVVAADGHPVSGSYRFRVSGVGARDAQAVANQLPSNPQGATPVQPNGPALTSSWRDLAPELGLVALAVVIFGAAMARRSRVKHEDLTHG